MGTGGPAQASLIAGKQPRLAYKWLALATTCSGSLVATITSSIVNIALPNIADSFATSLATVQWVIVIYPLITVSTMIAVGYLGDRVGRRFIFTAGAIIFALGSLLCGIAQDPWWLIGFRALQAIGGAMIVANSAAIITGAFPTAERGKAIGIQNTVASVGLSIGPTIGGLLVDSAGWRWVFLVAMPLTVVCALMAIFCLRDAERGKTKAPPFDVGGTVTLFIGLCALLLALSDGQDNGWLTVRTVGLGFICLVATLAFVRFENRAALPTVDLGMLRYRLFAACVVSGLVAYSTLFAVSFLMPFYLTQTAGYSPAEAGTLLTGVPLAMAATATFAGWLSDRFGSRWLCPIGLGVCVLGLLLLAQLGHTATYGEVGFRLVLIGLGLGIFITPNNSTMMGCAPPGRLGMASGMVATVRHMGIALGVAIASTVFSIRIAAYAGAATPSDPSRLFDPAASVGAFHDSYLAVALLCVFGLLVAMVRGPKRQYVP